MGKGGYAVPQDAVKPFNRAPSEKPPFTVGTLRKAIPAHCFERSLWRSSQYLLVDLVVMTALFMASQYIDQAAVPRWLAYGLLWPLYWFFQGAVGTGVWVIAHECGHQAFSKWQVVNDVVGLVLHSCLLVPYYSWKHSHRRHHSNTGSVDKDEVFVPTVKQQHEEGDLFNWGNFAPVRLFYLAVTLTLGWPMYLVANVSGRPYHRWANHFDPYSPIYSKRERMEVVISDCALIAVLGVLSSLGQTMGFVWLLKVYIIPYLVVNHWLVMITLLQHTHPELPHYKDKEWDWLRGALATVDRSYGFLDHVFHHIADTHVSHHLFSTMPHYHAEEATRALKPVLGDYYKRDDRNVFKAMWADWPRCQCVAPDTPEEGVLWYRK
jgi:omega-6 fatty acid desaturase (delta-12 desaturase)